MEFKLKSFKRAINVTRLANIHYFEFTKEYQTYKDRHAFRELVYVDRGEIRIDAEHYTGRLRQNQIIIHETGEIHSLGCSVDQAPNVIIIGFECEAEELDAFSSTPTLLSLDCQRLLTDVIKEGRTVFLPPYDVPNLKDMRKRRDFPFGADQMIKLKLETFLIELIRSAHAHPSSITDPDEYKMHEICRYINENVRERITLDDLCFLYGTNKTSLCASFKAVYGETIVGYINRKRIREAKGLFRDGGYNLTEISELVGFSSLHYFSRIFKKYEGISPTEYFNTIKSKLDLA